MSVDENTIRSQEYLKKLQGTDGSKLAHLPDKERIEYLMDSEAFFVIYRQIREFFKIFDTIRKQGKRIRTTSILVIGVSGSGKSSMVEAYIFLKGNDPVFHADFIEWPVIRVSMPPSSQSSACYESFLRSLGEPRPERGNNSQKLHRAFRVLEAAKTQLVFVDEIHNLLDCGGDGTQKNTLNVLKSVGNDCRIPFILVGTKRAENILTLNEEVESRFPALELKPFTKLPEDFNEFLAGFERMLPLKKKSKLPSNQVVKNEILKHSKGVTSKVAALLRAAAIVAIRDGTEKITLKEVKKGKKLIKNREVLE